MTSRTRKAFGRWWVIPAAVAVLLPVMAAGYLAHTDRLEFSYLRQRIYRAMGANPGPLTSAAIQRLSVPAGFKVQLYAQDLPSARFMRFTAAGDLLVTLRHENAVVLLERDHNGDGKADGSRVLLDKLSGPDGIDIRDGWLYVGESEAVGRVQIDEQAGKLLGPYQRIVTGLPHDGHWTKNVRIGPDGLLYVAQGSSCNVCVEQDSRRATIMRYNADGTDGSIYASGLRNSVGMDWSPADDALYATDNGRDLLGDDEPPDELDRIEAGAFYGWPYVHGFGVLDPDLGTGKEALLEAFVPPVHGFRAHNAPLGIHFLRKARVPDAYRFAALVALHGSWNRTTPDGYKVVSLHWRDDGSIEERDFLSGFLTKRRVTGRPVGVTEGPDGAIYVSDDFSGSIYRIAYDVANQIQIGESR